MFCGNCGKKLPDGASVCDGCGMPVVNDIIGDAAKKAEENLGDASEQAGEVIENAGDVVEKNAQEAEQTVTELAVSAESQLASAEEAVQTGILINGEPIEQEGMTKDEKTDEQKNGEKPEGEIKAGKLNLPLIIGGAVAAVAVILGIVILCSASLRNSLKKTFLSNESYFRSVEKNSTDKIFDTLITGYGKVMKANDLTNTERKFNAEFEFEEDADEFLSKLGIEWLKKGEAEAVFGIKDKAMYFNTDIDVNGKDIVEADASLDIENGKAYIGIPSLSKEYGAVDLASADNDYTKISDEFLQILEIKEFFPTEKELTKLYERYTEIFFDHIKKVKLYDEKSYSVEDIKMQNCTKAVSQLDDEDINELLMDIYTAMEDDNELAAIITRMSSSEFLGENISYDDFLDSLDEKIKNLENAKEQDRVLRIEAYITSSGAVSALDLSLIYNGGEENGGSSESIGYKYAASSKNYGMSIYSKTARSLRKTSTVEIVAQGTRDGNEITGSIIIPGMGTLEYGNLNLSSLKKFIIDGSIRFELEDIIDDRAFKRMQLRVDMDDVSFDGGKFVFSLFYNKAKYGEMELTVKSGSGSKVKEPSKKIDLESADDLTDWFDGFKWDKTLDNMEDAEFPGKIIRAIEAISEGNYLGLISLFN